MRALGSTTGCETGRAGMKAPLIRQEAICGLTVTAVGLLAALEALRYSMGSLMRMGPGFLPLVYALTLAAMGLGLLLTARRAPGDGEAASGEAGVDGVVPGDAAAGASTPDAAGNESAASAQPQLRPVLAVAGGMLAWVYLAPKAGFFLATMALVFIAATAEREVKPLQAVLVGAAAGLAGGFLFVRGFGVPLPMWPF
jgi:hypothetical protein